MNDHYISARARPRIRRRETYLFERKAFRMRFATKVFYAAVHMGARAAEAAHAPGAVAWPQRSF